MKLTYSVHWCRKRRRKSIPDHVLEYALSNSPLIKDRQWPDVFNAIARIPPSGRLLKVVHKRISKEEVKIITAFWLD